jgi:hypothetical protein
VIVRYLALLGIPLVKMVSSAGPEGKALIVLEVKPVSDQPRLESTGRKTTWLLSRLRN